jgi:hypothetical protein
MASHEGEPTDALAGSVMSRRAALQFIGTSAGAGLLVGFGQAPVQVAAQPESSESEAAPYVLMQRFQVTSASLLGQLTAIVESDMLPRLHEIPGFSGSLIYDTETGELVITSIFATKQGADEWYVTAGQWKAKDDSGRYLEYDAQVSLGGRLRLLGTPLLTPPTLSTQPTPPTPPTPAGTSTTGPGGWTQVLLSPDPGFINQAIRSEIINENATAELVVP